MPPLLPLFVYGTLRQGGRYHQPYLAGRFLSWQPATLSGRLFYEPREEYPCLLPGSGMARGEIYQLEPATAASTLARIDRLEEYLPDKETASLYLRREALAYREDGEEVKVWVYYWNGGRTGRPVPGNDYAGLLQRGWRKGGEE
ncbi:gamma-glutamylcyclotransferase [Desulfuromonas carbonis]|uniref:gamma-glutamylcyclotransferase family protein n=1 Tax=Desulfuromonas sp. DDH964 TaxID=1823759 RepID=UPI00078B720C|nr:gamma-glutamylcyclotransferase family protein [Desulfuromonas sp. DDH964]AMV73325.1 Gamma-L-glutamyl-butirosin B gamma-glutamyl cyclotransferase [Desulfuromonas sp. DDH964]